MTDRELMQMALDALRKCTAIPTWPSFMPVIKDLEARLAQPEPEPVATVYDAYDTTGIDWHCKDAPATGTKLYTSPPQREWQGLTDEEVKDVVLDNPSTSYELFGLIRDDVTVLLFRRAISDFIRAIEAKLKEKNT